MRLDATERDGAPDVDTFDFLCGGLTKTGDSPFTERHPRHLAGQFALETCGFTRICCEANDLFSALQGDQYG